MKMTADSLPNDPELLKQMLLGMQCNIDSLERNLSIQRSQNEQLKLRLASLLRHRFGRSSEKTANTDQLDLLIEDTPLCQHSCRAI
jgi:hypothetical protein